MSESHDKETNEDKSITPKSPAAAAALLSEATSELDTNVANKNNQSSYSALSARIKLRRHQSSDLPTCHSHQILEHSVEESEKQDSSNLTAGKPEEPGIPPASVTIDSTAKVSGVNTSVDIPCEEESETAQGNSSTETRSAAVKTNMSTVNHRHTGHQSNHSSMESNEGPSVSHRGPGWSGEEHARNDRVRWSDELRNRFNDLNQNWSGMGASYNDAANASRTISSLSVLSCLPSALRIGMPMGSAVIATPGAATGTTDVNTIEELISSESRDAPNHPSERALPSSSSFQDTFIDIGSSSGVVQPSQSQAEVSALDSDLHQSSLNGQDRRQGSHVINMEDWDNSDTNAHASNRGNGDSSSGSNAIFDGRATRHGGVNGDTTTSRDSENSTASDSPRRGSSNDRNPADILRQSPEVRFVMAILGRYFPFMMILIVKYLFDHGAGIVCFLVMFVTFSHTNGLFKKEVAKQAKRSLFYLLMICVNICGCIGIQYYVFEGDTIYQALIFMATKVEVDSLPILLWMTSVNDYVIKFATIFVKVLVLCVPAQISPFQRRGKFYLFIEQSSQMYRSLVTITPWVHYLTHYYVGSMQMFGLFLAGLYITCKVADIFRRFSSLKTAFSKMIKDVHYGSRPTSEEMADVGSTCPICHDAFSHPTKLICSHIFCEDCVATWFDRERTCPMCRSKVVDDPSYRDGSTTHFLQIY